MLLPSPPTPAPSTAKTPRPRSDFWSSRHLHGRGSRSAPTDVDPASHRPRSDFWIQSSPEPWSPRVLVAARVLELLEMLTAICRIEGDATLSDLDKARARQELLDGATHKAEVKDGDGEDNEDGKRNFCRKPPSAQPLQQLIFSKGSIDFKINQLDQNFHCVWKPESHFRWASKIGQGQLKLTHWRALFPYQVSALS